MVTVLFRDRPTGERNGAIRPRVGQSKKVAEAILIL